MYLLKIFAAGWIVLVVAIFINTLAVYFKVETWYSFIENVQKIGFYSAFFKISFFSKLFIFILYPLILGLSIYFSFKLLK